MKSNNRITKAELIEENTRLKDALSELDALKMEKEEASEISANREAEIKALSDELAEVSAAWKLACEKLGALMIIGGFRALKQSHYTSLRAKAGLPMEFGDSRAVRTKAKDWSVRAYSCSVNEDGSTTWSSAF